MLTLKQKTFSKPIREFIERNQISEEFFAKIFSKQKNTKLIYEPSNTAYTNGQEIHITPAFQNLYMESALFRQADNMLGYSRKYPKLTFNQPNQIYFVSHALLVHECLHIIYTDFTININADKEVEPRHKRLLSSIHNIIEDAYIEAAGSIQFKEIKYLLLLLRTLCGLKNNQRTEEEKAQEIRQQPLIRYINYIIKKILFPVTKQEIPQDDIKKIIEKTEPLFYEGISQPSCRLRYYYSKKILNELIKSGIADQGQNEDPGKGLQDPNTGTLGDPDSSTGDEFELDQDLFGRNLSDAVKNAKSENSSSSNTLPEELLKSLQEELQKNPNAEKLLEDLQQAMQESQSDSIKDNANQAKTNIKSGADLDPVYNRKITYQEKTYSPQKKSQADYEQIKQTYKPTIKKYQKFINSIKSTTEIKEGGYKYGTSIDSSNLADSKKRYWQRKVEDIETPELVVSLLIDGSGSMCGEKELAAKKASIILHEILTSAKINHRIAEFRSMDDVTAEHNVLINYNHKENDKYNLANIDSNGCNRDGLAIRWALNDILKQPQPNKIIIVISDGLPSAYNNYSEAEGDLKGSIKKAKTKKVPIIAIALEDETVYQSLKNFYKNILYCKKLEKLPDMLAKIITETLLK